MRLMLINDLVAKTLNKIRAEVLMEYGDNVSDEEF